MPRDPRDPRPIIVQHTSSARLLSQLLELNRPIVTVRLGSHAFAAGELVWAKDGWAEVRDGSRSYTGPLVNVRPDTVEFPSYAE